MHARHSVTDSNFYDALLHTPKYGKEASLDREEIGRILEFIGLKGEEPKIANGMSYGKQGKLGIAMALTTNPQILLLDEPLAGMNPRETLEMIDIIRKIRDMGTTIFLIEHNMKATMSLCNTIMVLDHGKKIAEGSPSDISRSPEVIKAYLGKEYNAGG